MTSRLADACKAVNNAIRNRKREVHIFNMDQGTRSFFFFMRDVGYMTNVVQIQSNNKEKTVLILNGRLNKCSAICPSFSYAAKEVPTVAEKLKPARQFGHVLFNTNKGVLDHLQANKEKVGGKILGFFY